MPGNLTIYNKMSNIKPGDINYGKPVAGSKTEARGKKAHERISNEIVELVSHFMNFHSTKLSQLRIEKYYLRYFIVTFSLFF